MSIKDKALNLPVWKAAIIILLFMFGLVAIFEEILFHTIFKVFDSGIAMMQRQSDDDLADLEEMDHEDQEKQQQGKKEDIR